ncbi:MAG: c-type cytochrome, partial [Planctomycetaceae bacterium]|nr:c-type cytochrome [Planctomycetaceae bacterium]
EGLNLVSGLEVGFGGVYVGAAPYLMFIPDRDGDDVPDAPAGAVQSQPVQFPKDVPPGATVLRDGFGWQDTHETLNAFIWGPDGWLYGCHGVFTHSRVGRPGEPDEQRVPMNAAVWRYHPTKDIFETFMNGTSNPWGVDFNDRGQAFITACVIPHLWHVIQGARYHRQGGQHFNPYTYDDIKTIADHAHYVGNIRDHAWWGHEPRAAGDTSAAGGGHAHAGGMIYLGDNWPDQYRNHIFFNNIHGNRINNDLLEKIDGESGYVGHHGADFLLANDHYYRGINLRYGPDGTVCLIDWYDKNACHRTNPEIWDRTNGRVYRVSWGIVKSDPVNLADWDQAQLLDAHEHRNEWFARTARRMLMHRGAGADAAAACWQRAADSERDVAVRLRYLWTAHALAGLADQQVLTLLNDQDEYVRAWAVQLELEDQSASAAVRRRLEELARTDSSAVVRLYLASALQRLPLEQRWELAGALSQHAEDADDHNLPLLLWYGIEPLVTTDAARAMTLARAAKIPLLQNYIVRRASGQNETVGAVVESLAASAEPVWQLMLMQEMLAAFEGRVGVPMPKEWQQTYGILKKSENGEVQDRADQLAVIFGDQRVFPLMRNLLADDSQELRRRRQALHVLVRGLDRPAADVLLGDSVLKNEELRGPAVRALVTLGNDRVPAVLLTAYASFDAATQSDVISTLVSRPQWATALLQAIGRNTVPSRDLHAFHVRQILSFNNSELNDLLKQNWGEIREASADRKQQVAEWKKLLTPVALKEAHPGNGRRVFAKTCEKCHRLFGTGGEIGPDITGSNRANLDYILENILDPSAVVGRDYQMTVVALSSGQVINGLLKNESDSALTIQTINDRVVVPKSEIEDRTLSNVSMMPERQLDDLTKEEVRDLIAYLASPVQVALSGPPSPIDGTGKVPGAQEGETLKIVEKSGGSARSQPMGNFRADRWSGNDQLWWTGGKPGDRLAVEVSVPADGSYVVELALTKARDYGMFRLAIDDQVLDASLDLFNDPEVVTTGMLSYSRVSLKKGTHRLSFEVIGAHPEAAKAYMLGLDYVRLTPAE